MVVLGGRGGLYDASDVLLRTAPGRCVGRIDQQTLGRASRIAGGFPSSRVVNGSVGLGE